VESACGRALGAAAEYAGLGGVESPPVPELVDRREWARNALAGLSDAAGPVEARVAADLDLPGPLGGIARRGVGAAIGVEAGPPRLRGCACSAIRHRAVRPGRPPPAVVGENMEATRRSLEADHDDFLHWVALHECTHVIQFERVAGCNASARARPWTTAPPRSSTRPPWRGLAGGSLATPALVRKAAVSSPRARRSEVPGDADWSRRRWSSRGTRAMMDASAAALGPSSPSCAGVPAPERRGGSATCSARLLGLEPLRRTSWCGVL
jgi:hypothetical protein